MRRSRLVLFLVLVCVLVVYLTVLKRHYDSHNALPQRHPAPKGFLTPHWPTGSRGRVQFGIMFDAGSTGTRVHVFKFRVDHNKSRVPELLDESFKAFSPGLSAFAEDPPQSRAGLLQLLDFAKTKVPVQIQESTPVFLKATAGLRLLKGDQAQRLLDQVRQVFRESSFLSSDQSVSVLDGADEGVSAWLTVNFLLGAVGGAPAPASASASVGTLDLGGGSTQVTFSPSSKFVESLSSSDAQNLQNLNLFNSSYKLYTHSYLGLGLMEARAAVLGPPSAPGGAVLVSPCVSPDGGGTWEHDHILYNVRGQRTGETTGSVLELCSRRVRSVLRDSVRPVEQQLQFYAFSYYYDRAVDIRAIDGVRGGEVCVQDYISAAQRVCAGETLSPDQSPLLCLDLVYISVLLQDLGFKPDSQLKLSRWIRGVETSWALGATFNYMNL
ncbi:ectonucleoside triphosphate diphosphohydrolase 6 isoform X4 [Boleophthalmus pectinirostris]|uniref:ectonucleoside triphosphate diphosphohydrolase 6 isoform X4 n=1 Tax=Boleophthalmus pectinirostris TaxID=150288 RepID=UPI00242F3E04|nr:ectonucleoside triphosphate diphosphohydrolase 6 isoform X4 [Boleophthalmus pectinirostris]